MDIFFPPLDPATMKPTHVTLYTQQDVWFWKTHLYPGWVRKPFRWNWRLAVWANIHDLLKPTLVYTLHGGIE